MWLFNFTMEWPPCDYILYILTINIPPKGATIHKRHLRQWQETNISPQQHYILVVKGHCDTLIVIKTTQPKFLALTLETPILEWHMVAWLVVKNGHHILILFIFTMRLDYVHTIDTTLASKRTQYEERESSLWPRHVNFCISTSILNLRWPYVRLAITNRMR